MTDITAEKSLATAISDLKIELRDFIETRYQMFVLEMKSRVTALKMAAPMIAVGMALGMLALMLLSAALVTLIAMSLGGQIGDWAKALAIIGGCYFVIGSIAGLMGWLQITKQGLGPSRTLNVLKQDQAWLQSETRSQL